MKVHVGPAKPQGHAPHYPAHDTARRVNTARTTVQARFEALRRAWLRRRDDALRTQTHTLRDQMQRGEGRVGAREDHDSTPDNLATA